MSRAALLPYPGDPFLLNYWLKFFDEVWGDEVDTMYICLNSPIEAPVVTYIIERVAASNVKAGKQKVFLNYVGEQIDHGPAIDRLLDQCQEDFVMLVEDDGFIFKKGVVDNYFQQLEAGLYKIIGSKRGSCSMEILTAAQNKWGLTYEGEGDHGPNFWPNFLFLKADLLRATDRNFSAKQWRQGKLIHGLDHIVESEFVHGDTLVNTSLQLRGMVPIHEILCVPQYHGSPDDLEHFARGKYLFDGIAPWTHVGSLSSGVGGILMDNYGRSLSRRLIDPPQAQTKLPAYANSDQERNEFERRVQWWLRFIDYFDEFRRGKISNEVLEFAELYRVAVERIILQYNLSRSNIRQRQNIYKTLGL